MKPSERALKEFELMIDVVEKDMKAPIGPAEKNILLYCFKTGFKKGYKSGKKAGIAKADRT